MRPIVYRDLSKSTYKKELPGFTLIFSSQFYLDNFNKKIDAHTEKIENEFFSRFGVKASMSTYSAIVLYNKIEKRGFRIINEKGEVVTWLNNLTLDGVIRTTKN